nr:(Fe-S)-binding protein [Candidatus Sigynarchaeum springense]
MVKPVDIGFFSEFKKDACNLCGECLHRCPIMKLPKEMAIDEMRRLIAGEKTKRVLKDCQSCFSCNFYCPTNAKPASLVLQRWSEQYRENGLKVRGRYYMTLYPHYPNFRTHVVERMPEESRTLVAQWASTAPLKGDTLAYPGCNVITYPELTRSNLFHGLDIRGRLEYCCGETLFRTGYTQELQKIAKRLDRWFNVLKPAHLIVLCTAGTNIFKNVLPHHGLTYKFQSVKSYLQYIWEKIESGEIAFKHEVSMTVSIQESCYAKMFGDEYMDLPRKILKRIGVTVVEAPACKEHMRCCGIGGGFSVDSAYHPMSLIKSASRNLADFKKTGADAVCVYCAGCLAVLGIVQKTVLGKKMPVYHIIELLQRALGEPPLPEAVKAKRNATFFWGIVKNQFPKVLSRKTFKIAEIEEIPPDYGTAL